MIWGVTYSLQDDKIEEEESKMAIIASEPSKYFESVQAIRCFDKQYFQNNSSLSSNDPEMKSYDLTIRITISTKSQGFSITLLHS